MARIYSENYMPFPTLADTPDFGHIAPHGVGHTRFRRTQGLFTFTASGDGSVDLTTADELRFCDIPSSARIVEVNHVGDANQGINWTTTLGLYKKGNENDGPAVDADCFHAALDLGTAGARVDRFQGAGFTDMDRGKPIWSLVTAVPALTFDPLEMWTLTAVLAGDAAASAAGEIGFEILYVSGD